MSISSQTSKITDIYAFKEHLQFSSADGLSKWTWHFSEGDSRVAMG
jgi:hypothetical protein